MREKDRSRKIFFNDVLYLCNCASSRRTLPPSITQPFFHPSTHSQMRPKSGHIFSLSAPIRIGSRRFPLELLPRPASSISTAAPTYSSATAAAGAAGDASLGLPGNVTQALISGDFARHDSYGAVGGHPDTGDIGSGGDVPSAPPQFSPKKKFLEDDAPPPYNPEYASPSVLVPTDDIVDGAIAARSADVTLSDTMHECGICMVNTKDCAFDCGHLACSECAELLTDCHICRQRITGKRKIFL